MKLTKYLKLNFQTFFLQIVELIAQMESKDKDIERQQDECRHLVKLSEQRR